MGSQFVDFNADGHLDYVTAIFDGSPRISYGSREGYGKPEILKDAQGERVLISDYWDYEQRKHTSTTRSSPGGKELKERCISALAFDWDGDGDHDLLLGSYENGHLYRQMNEGSDAKPKFTGKNVPVMAGDIPFGLPAKMTTPRLVDWDGDGDMDLIAGSFGDSYGQGRGGGVYLSINGGQKGAPEFGPLRTLVPPSQKGQAAPTRPDAGLYAEAVDYDGDGDLDLVVGGYSMWTPAPRELNETEQATVARLRKEQKAARKQQTEFFKRQSAAIQKATAGMKPGSEEWRKKQAEVRGQFREESAAARKAVAAIQKQLDVLVPSKQRRSFVWLYERL